MAWHSKWHNIKHRKAAQDAKKAKVYTKVWKIIQIAAKWWSDPSLNPTLQWALEKAKQLSVPKNVIENAIKKGSGQIQWEQLQEIFYEWYWPWWTAIYIKCITWNTNRSWASVRSILTKYSANLWEPWSVSWQFEEKWVLYVVWRIENEIVKWNNIEKIIPFVKEELENDLLEWDIEDYEISDEWVKIITSRENFIKSKNYFENKQYKIDDAQLEFIPQNYIDISDEEYEKLQKILENLEEDDDVDEIYHNAN